MNLKSKLKNLNFKIRTLQIVNHSLMIFGVVYVAYQGQWIWFGIGLASFLFVGIFGANIALHRFFGHRSFETSRRKEVVLAYLSILPTMGTTIGWVGLHRFHHGHSDVDEDPHSPHKVGNFNAWVGFWKNVKINPRLVSDLIRDPVHKFIHKNYF